MRWTLGLVILISVLSLAAFQAVKTYPYRTYSKWMKGEGHDKYFSLKPYKQFYLKPVDLTPIPAYQEDYVQLWRAFPLRNSMIPLPTRHPMFQTVPIVELKEKMSSPQIGMVILGSTGRELFRIYTLPTSLYPDHTQGQELFKLPYVKNRILKKDLDTIWKDVFSMNLEVKTKSMEQMIYDLYILHLRSKLLPPQSIRYGLVQDGKLAVIELTSANKDYMVELVMSLVNGTIYSHVLVTEKSNEDSEKLRAKFLKEIHFSPMDEAMGRILYTEFKQLNFARQVDQEGMVYLFSAWSQNSDSPELLKEMIFYLERGQKYPNQLKVLYEYAFRKYGKTFTGSRHVNENEGPDLQLQRKIEIETLERRQQAERNKQGPVQSDLTPDERMNLYLKKAKESQPVPKEDMTVH